MRSLKDIEQDVLQFLSKVEEIGTNDRKDLLMAIFQKHIILNESDLHLNKHDFDTVLGLARGRYVKEALPISISGKVLLPQESLSLMTMESTMEVLNSKGALKRLPSFNRRQK
jgi:hypothetical protein